MKSQCAGMRHSQYERDNDNQLDVCYFILDIEMQVGFGRVM